MGYQSVGMKPRGFGSVYGTEVVFLESNSATTSVDASPTKRRAPSDDSARDPGSLPPNFWPGRSVSSQFISFPEAVERTTTRSKFESATKSASSFRLRRRAVG